MTRKFTCRTCSEEPDTWGDAQAHADEKAHVVDVWDVTSTLVPGDV